MIGSPQPPIPSDPAPRGRGPVLGCLAVMVLLGTLLIVWLMGWPEQRRTGERAERARIHHLRRVSEDQLRRGVSTGAGETGRPGAATPESVRAGEVLTGRARELHTAGDWAGVIQCIGLLEDLTANDPELGLMLETALFNHALQQLQRGRAIPALESLERLLTRTPADREVSDMRSIGWTIRDYGPDQRTAEALAQFNERR